MELITCVITTYKRPIEVLKRAVDSVIAQTYKNIELIVVNDAPQDHVLSDEIRSFLNDYRTIPIKYLVHKKNMGACQARNTAIEQAQGKYIAFLDDDDEWLQEKIAKQYKLIKEKNVSLVYCSHYEIYINNPPVLIREELAKVGLNNDEFDRLLRANFVGSTSFPLLNLESVKSVGGFNIDLKSSQDHELWIRIAKRYPIFYCDEPLVNYYCSEISISSSLENFRQGIGYLLDMYDNYYQTHIDTYNYRLNYIAYMWLKRKKYMEFMRYKIMALKLKPISKFNFLTINKLKNKIIIKIKK